MVFCGVTAQTVESVGQDEIVRGEVDPPKVPWSAVDLEERDLSDHYLLRSKISLTLPRREAPNGNEDARSEAENGV